MAKRYGKDGELPEQMQMSFSISPYVEYETPDRIYQYPELLKHTYFLNNGSESVTRSRKAYQQSLKGEKDTSSIPMTKEDLTKQFDTGFSIRASIDYGLPNETDGLVWDYFKKVASKVKLIDGKFYHLYFFNTEDIVQELIRVGVFTGRGGKQNRVVDDCISRLFRTAYKYEKGVVVRSEKGEKGKPHKEMLHSAEFNLINAIYKRGEVLGNGDMCKTQYAVAINPLIIQSLKEDHYFIVNNQRRELLTRYPTKVLYDRLSAWGYAKYKQKELLPLGTLGITPFQVISYEYLCQILGYEPVKMERRRPSSIKDQLKKVHEELLDANVIEWFMIESNKARGKDRSYKIVYAYSKSFLEDIARFENEQAKIAYRNTAEQYTLSIEETENTLKKINGQIKSQKIRNKLLKHLFVYKDKKSEQS